MWPFDQHRGDAEQALVVDVKHYLQTLFPQLSGVSPK